ncbi:MAG TPA: SDR family oxidoreductase [Xanthobacteraceae bacterium]|nr:SDR family oxidoreductase [Xanthobacteraceae bacterium]
MDLHLRGKSALITGASKGIGAAIAEALAEEGCHLHLAARTTDALNATAQRLRSKHQVNVTVHTVDLRKRDDLASLIDSAPDVDILVNNAGDIPGGSLERIDDATWRHAWDLKVFGFINLTRLFYARMKTRGHGVIINIIGAAGERVDANYIVGSAGNASLMAFTRALGGASLKDHIRVVGINPGPVATDRITALMKRQALARYNDESRYPEMMAQFPLGRAAKPREIADMAAFLASERSAYTSGVIITIDGGICASGGF